MRSTRIDHVTTEISQVTSPSNFTECNNQICMLIITHISSELSNSMIQQHKRIKSASNPQESFQMPKPKPRGRRSKPSTKDVNQADAHADAAQQRCECLIEVLDYPAHAACHQTFSRLDS